jgi:lipopolysaccharide export system permease protein
MIQTRRSFFSWYLTKYLAREILFSFFSGTLVFLLIMLSFQAIRLSEFVVVHQVSLKDSLHLSFDMMLAFVSIALPIAFLFSVLMGISRANSEGEILALQVNGLSLGQIFAPLAIFSLVLTAISLYVSMYTAPKGNRAFELLFTRLASERVISRLKPGVFQQGFFGLVLFTEHIVPMRNEMHHVFIFDDREEAHPMAITAQLGILKADPDKGVMTLRLSNGSMHLEDHQLKTVLQKIDFDVYDINLTLEHGDEWRDYSMPSYTYPQLHQRLLESSHDQTEHRKLEVELHRRLSLSFSCLVFAALGFFIGALSQRGVRSTAILLCLLVAMLYWLAFLAANALAGAGAVAPWLGIWAPNVLFSIIAYLCYRRYAR